MSMQRRVSKIGLYYAVTQISEWPVLLDSCPPIAATSSEPGNASEVPPGPEIDHRRIVHGHRKQYKSQS